MCSLSGLGGGCVACQTPVCPDAAVGLHASSQLTNRSSCILFHRGEVVRDGVRVAILGPPNAGKSTLLNELAQR